jgi:hypothetical protein
MSSDGRDAVFVGTILTTGDAVALCDECLVPWAAALLNAMTGVDPAPFIAAVSDQEPVVQADPAAIARAIEEDEASASTQAQEGPLDGTGPRPVEEAVLAPPAPSSARRGRTSAVSPEAGTGNGRPADGPATLTETEPRTA